MGKSQWFNSNYFQYGEVGTGITGLKESELFQGSANTIVNMDITELGTLKVAKEFEYTGLDLLEPPVTMLETNFSFHIFIGENKIFTTSADSAFTPIDSRDHVVDSKYLKNCFFYQGLIFIVEILPVLLD